ncbi:MAG: NADPH-dependent 7-cyano-7-deazaguanine reductase QueF [Actinobacteria bacterium]|nr:NADPH-dependent 7-cyano-7-deazaguanine reductase QueF [Actinomycetota bacterium]
MADTGLLERFANPHPGRDYLVEHTSNEFTSVCPKTAQPDFATVVISYLPNKWCVELKSLKLYLTDYRNQGIYYEDVTNVILNDLAKLCEPRWMQIECNWNVRGGISSRTVASVGQRPEEMQKGNR